ncbi:hypothetical protein WOLCODRAFT_62257 [Wolfiporia cocos MD-104 SS10]|uniref:Inhibitor of growth protein N-terminal histone-binding domain-containing protein n=1 Tax=Wolfiporia cocos (strain MD-104) TaxID=742152 RepID=A0A2H3J670_WOLCO|nr:hypothetical protein WOLCODRAFT_62257 [Wolfiporia cocos MD-104 SS10]
MSRRAPNMSNNAAIATAHTLSLLGEYTHSLDSLPLDLSRSFGDLRELDAVLSLSMTTLTTKINQLTTMLEKNMMSKEDRLWLLVDIAEEAARLKAGNDDKIRVACYAADNIRGHKAHMKTLIEHVPDHDFGSIQLLGRKTVFPHVATRSYMPVGGTGEGGRRQRRAAYLSVGGVDASPNKRKRAGGRDEDPDVVGKTPRKERAGDGARQRNAARNKRVVERAASPTESLVSVASHLPTATQGGSATNGRTANGNANNKRSRATNNAHDASTQERAHQDLYSGPPSSSTTHPSLAIPFSNNISALNGVHVANVSYLDLPDLASLSRACPQLTELTQDPVLHHLRIHVVAPSRVSHSLFGQSAAGVPLRPTVPDLVHRGIMRGLGIERRWRTGMYLHSQHMVTQYENSLRLQRKHAGNVVESALRRRSSKSLMHVYSLRVLPEESSSPGVSPSLIPAMRRLKWSIQRDRLARFVRGRSDMMRNGGVVAWLEGRGKAVMRREHERVRLAVCPGISGIVRFYEDLSRG